LDTDSTFEDFTYTVTLYHTSDDSKYDSKTITAVNPHPTCEVSGTMTTSLGNPTGSLEVDHTWTLVHSYTCSIETITADLFDETFLTSDVDAKVGKNSLATAPDGLPDLIYDNFPI
jgi:hypothetical protein